MLHIVHINDTEGEPVNVWPRMATVIGAARAAGQCDLLLHAGDIPLDGDFPNLGVHAMAQLGFDAVVPGNHDLAENDAMMRADLELLNTPMLCANVEGLPAGLVQPYRRLLVKGWRIVVIGVTLGDLPRYVMQRRTAHLAVHPPEEVLAELVPSLRKDADLVIVLSHAGEGTDRTLPGKVPGIDLVVGGHDHLVLPAPKRVDDGWVVQAGAEGRYVGHVSVMRQGGSIEITGELLPTEGVLPDARLYELLMQTKPDPAELEIVGYTATDLGVPGVDVRSPELQRETPLGNLTVDLMRAYAGTDLALLRCSTVFNELPAGPIRRGDVRRLNWCGSDQVVCVALTGWELTQVLESGARGGYHLLLTSGARVRYDANHLLGDRISWVNVGDERLALDRTYTIACSEVLANGVSDYPVLASKQRVILPQTIEGLLADHIRSTGTIHPQLDGRLVIDGRWELD